VPLRTTLSIRPILTAILALIIYPLIVGKYIYYLYRFIELIKRFKILLFSSIYLKAKQYYTNIKLRALRGKFYGVCMELYTELCKSSIKLYKNSIRYSIKALYKALLKAYLEL
jgi:hypothetical protein